jgi:hypothetical protein
VGAVKVLSFAVSNNRDAAIKLVEQGGLKLLFPILMGRGLPNTYSKTSKNSKSKEVKEAEETCLITIAQLCVLLCTVSEQDCCHRLLAKFIENGTEKLDRCVDLFETFSQTLIATDGRIQNTIRALEAAEDDEAVEEFSSDENIEQLVM